MSSHEILVSEIRCVIIGVGGIAKLYARAMQDVEHLQLVGGCCRSEDKGRQFSSDFGCPWYADYCEMLEKEKPDFALVTTPSGAHLEPSLACFERGVHVLCDKPLEITTARCDEMIAAAERAGVSLGCMFQTRMLDSFTLLHEAAVQGRFGSISFLSGSVPWWRDDEYYAPSRWQGTQALDGGGACMNQGIHTLDALIYLAHALMPELPPDANPIAEVCAYTATRAHDPELVEVEDTATVSLRFRNGALGQFVAGTSMFPGGDRSVAVHGRNGTAVVTGDEVTRFDFRERRPSDDSVARAPVPPGGAASDPLALPTEPPRRIIAAFAQSLRPGGPLYPVPGREARKAVDVICAIYKSAREHQAIAIRAPVSAAEPS